MFACRDALAAAGSDLLSRHGHIPGFRASIHYGPLVAGEVGGFKREIALLGDAMNTAARLEQACRTTGRALLASKPLLDRTEIPAGVVATSLGSHLLRGKSEWLELFALERAAEDGANRLSVVAGSSARADSAGASELSRVPGEIAEAGTRLHHSGGA
jgi:adenylate cyclase